VVTEQGSVTELDLQYNGLSGQLPPELGNLANLTLLDLRFNNFTGPIPPELGNLANLTKLDFGHFPLFGGLLSGPIPPELGSLANLTVLDLGGNQLSGQIPPELGKLSHLTVLGLADNRLSGPLPVEFADLATLRLLHLHKNLLTGPIPAEFGRMSRLHELTLSFNEEMAGPLPFEMTSLGRLNVLLAEGTELCAPSDSAFQTWLEGVDDHRIATCQDGDPPMAYLIQAVQSQEFTLPVRSGWEGSLATLTLAGPGGSVPLDPGSDLPIAILRDPRNGQVRAILRDEPDLEMEQADVTAALGAHLPAGHAGIVGPGACGQSVTDCWTDSG
jgi:hypothetical protein